jgi:hypothetical protein
MQPKTLFLSLTVPAAIHVGESEWDLNRQLRIEGTDVDGNDTPWCALADLLVDRTTRVFLGVTFGVEEHAFERARRIAQSLNPEVVRYDDVSTEVSKERYRGWGDTQRFEIAWTPARDLRCEGAQLLCGQWFWWYALTKGQIDWNRPIAFGISDIDDILRDHNLTFPDVSHLPALKVESL